MISYIDVCSGLSAPTLAWKPLGWRALCYSEIEAAPRSVLRHRYPDTPLHGDFTKLRGDEHGPVDLLVGGTPCQDYSVAGLRAGLDGAHGNITLEFSRLAYRARTRWLAWENVPGVLSSNNGRDFGAILATFSGRHGLIYQPPAGGWGSAGVVEPADPGSFGLAWRVLDAQFFGVPQRRRRVFLVGYLGDSRRAAAVLLERAGLSGNPAPRREAGPSVAALTANRVGTCGADDNQGQAGHLIASTGNVPHCLNAGGMGRQDYETETLITHSLRAEGFDASEDGTGRGTPLVPVCFTAKDHGADASDISPTLRSGSHSGSHAIGGVMPAVAFNTRQDPIHCPVAQPIGAKDDGNGLLQGSAVRRLTPRECERLQGIPDDFTLVPYRKGLMADGPRYKMIGNSWAVPVGRWLGERIDFVERLG